MREHELDTLWRSLSLHSVSCIGLYRTNHSNCKARTALQTVLLTILLLTIMGVICSLTTKSLHKIILWFAPINSSANFPHHHPLRLIILVLASISICVALLILTPEKQSAKWVFTHVTDGSGWGSKGFSFLLGYGIYGPWWSWH